MKTMKSIIELLNRGNRGLKGKFFVAKGKDEKGKFTWIVGIEKDGKKICASMETTKKKDIEKIIKMLEEMVAEES